MSRKSIIPPNVEPPHIPKSRAVNSIRHNVRAYVIGFCFLWGTLLGFIYHVTREEPVEKEPGDGPKVVVEKTQNIEDIIKSNREKKSTDATLPPEAEKIDIPMNTDAADAIIKDSEKQLQSIRSKANVRRQETKMAPLPKSVYGGLTGRNAPLPRFGNTSSPLIDSSALSPSPELNIDDSEMFGPELD